MEKRIEKKGENKKKDEIIIEKENEKDHSYKFRFEGIFFFII
jgi:hypothetical protein